MPTFLDLLTKQAEPPERRLAIYCMAEKHRWTHAILLARLCYKLRLRGKVRVREFVRPDDDDGYMFGILVEGRAEDLLEVERYDPLTDEGLPQLFLLRDPDDTELLDKL